MTEIADMTLVRLQLTHLQCLIIDGTLDNEADTQRVHGNDRAADWAAEIRVAIAPQLRPHHVDPTLTTAPDQRMHLELQQEHWSFVRAVLHKWSAYARTPEDITVRHELLQRLEQELPGLAELPADVLQPAVAEAFEEELSDEEAIARLKASHELRVESEEFSSYADDIDEQPSSPAGPATGSVLIGYADDGPGESAADALGALQAWVLTEDAYERGGVPDEVLSYLQDHIGRLLGPHAVFAAGDHLRQHVEAGGSLTDLARDRTALRDLLEVIEGRRRRGFELEWRAERSVDQDGSWRPEALLVMAEHCVEDPVWDRPRGTGELVPLLELGVAESLVHRLRAWNESWERSALDDDWSGSGAQAAWVQQGLLLAQELQRELPEVDVRYFHADDDRPLRSF
ncbi:hypothetical protein GTR02_01460 [Kineococcus sp. R8]|uniref:hypothetical protein n=1 Tax=Kineococcus siccus TaxID=2696567 RepID=UPI001412C7AB|nr:hypothetical protein [Kineococcus siccus]NAZ80485.1 hypothetical protein [Kineococcus siccus]